MGKGKSEGKKAKTAQKKEKQQTKSTKKEKKAAKADDDDLGEDDVDLDQVLDEYRRRQEQFLKITEAVCAGPPQPRAASTIMANPAGARELLLFGGEYWNNAVARFYNDLNVYNVDRDEWRAVTSPNAPLPRSGHAWCRAGNPNHVYLFGGEFSSPKQGTFHHYSDLWRLEPATREWARVEPARRGGAGAGGRAAPPARSGHRMTYWKHYIILFGGFQDTSNQTRYLADLWVFDTRESVWFCPTLPPAQLKPDARSSFTFLPHEHGAVLFGGYSQVKAAAAAASSSSSSSKRAAAGVQKKAVLRPVVHQDCFFLRMSLPPEGAPAGAPPTVRWERRKRPANTPVPARAGSTMAWHKGRGILFGGVHDVDDGDDGLESEFFNGLFAWNIERNRFFPLPLRRPRGGGAQKQQQQQRVGRRGRAQAGEAELLKQLAALESGAPPTEDTDGMELDRAEEDGHEDEDEPAKPRREMPVSTELPRPRFNAQLAVLEDVLYIYGGTTEKGNREYTLDDLYAIDLGKMDGCKEIFQREADDWVPSEDEDDDAGDDDDDESGDDEDAEERDEDSDVEMADESAPKRLLSPSKRKKEQQQQQASLSDSWSTISPPPRVESIASLPEEEEAAELEKEDDGLPHPRPFETRRDFFVRTSAQWQEVLMTGLRWKGIQPETTLTVKEIKARAFQLAEDKWWDCREEIIALEEEQEVAGITEVVSLAERGDAGGGAGRRR